MCCIYYRKNREEIRKLNINKLKSIKTYEKCKEILNQLSESDDKNSDIDFLIFLAVNNNSIFLLECLKFYYIEKFSLDQFKYALKLKNNHGNTPLHVCAINNYLECFKYLLDNDANILEKNNKGLSSFEILKKKDIDILV